jgi:hypothetical protein
MYNLPDSNLAKFIPGMDFALTVHINKTKLMYEKTDLIILGLVIFY